jgi:hypothetical protein
MEIWSTLPVSVKGLAKGATVAWKSSDKTVATVTKDKTGQAAKLYVKKVGKAKITAKVTVDKKVTATYTLTVTVKDSTAKAAVTPTAAPTPAPTAKPTAAPTPTTPPSTGDASIVGTWVSEPLEEPLDDPLRNTSVWFEFGSDGTFTYNRGAFAGAVRYGRAFEPNYKYSSGFDYCIFKGNYTVLNGKIYCTNVKLTAISTLTGVTNYRDQPIDNIVWSYYFDSIHGYYTDESYEDELRKKFTEKKWLHISNVFYTDLDDDASNDGFNPYAKPGSVSMEEWQERS